MSNQKQLRILATIALASFGLYALARFLMDGGLSQFEGMSPDQKAEAAFQWIKAMFFPLFILGMAGYFMLSEGVKERDSDEE